MIILKEKEHIIIIMAILIMAVSLKENQVVMAFICMLMEVNILANGQMLKRMDMVFCITQAMLFTKATGKKTNVMD